MKKRNFFDTNNVYKNGDGLGQLPTENAYVCTIKSAKVTSNDYGEKLEVAIDVSEGDYAGFYQKKYDYDKSQSEDAKWKGVVRINIPNEDGSEQDSWRIKSFNTNICAVMDSNPGYTWEWKEETLKGKKVGLVLRDKEYAIDGRSGFYSEPYRFISVEDARNNDFRKPAIKYLPTTNTASSSLDLSAVDSATEDEIPF